MNRSGAPQNFGLALGRRRMLGSSTVGLAAAMMSGSARAAPAHSAPTTPRFVSASRIWMPVPAQVPAHEGLADLPGAKLWYWDTGGAGETIVLLHANTGSAMSWGYQQPVFARAGYRVIGYSRRGHANSERGSPDNPGTVVDDLHNLLTFLRVEGKVHLLGTALGGFVLPDYAISYPDKVATLIFASSQGGVTEPAFRQKISSITSPPFSEMPASFLELGPSYRASATQGVAEWEALERAAVVGPRLSWQRKNRLLWDDIGGIRTPALVFTGDADLYMPVPLMLEFASHLPQAETAVLSESGHSAYWEQPAAFNALVLDFIRRHPARKT